MILKFSGDFNHESQRSQMVVNWSRFEGNEKRILFMNDSQKKGNPLNIKILRNDVVEAMAQRRKLGHLSVNDETEGIHQSMMNN